MTHTANPINRATARKGAVGTLTTRFEDVRAEVRALRIALGDERVPAHAKGAVFLAVGYALNPFDVVPDFVPGAGQIDDIVVVPMLLSAAWWFVPPDVRQEIREQAEEEVEDAPARFPMMIAALAALWSLLGYVVAALLADR